MTPIVETVLRGAAARACSLCRVVPAGTRGPAARCRAAEEEEAPGPDQVPQDILLKANGDIPDITVGKRRCESHRRGIRVAVLQPLRKLPQQGPPRIQGEIHRHGQGAADPPRVPDQRKRARRGHAHAVRDAGQGRAPDRCVVPRAGRLGIRRNCEGQAQGPVGSPGDDRGPIRQLHQGPEAVRQADRQLQQRRKNVRHHRHADLLHQRQAPEGCGNHGGL